jgi:hypothetical protein
VRAGAAMNMVNATNEARYDVTLRMVSSGCGYRETRAYELGMRRYSTGVYGGSIN